MDKASAVENSFIVAAPGEQWMWNYPDGVWRVVTPTYKGEHALQAFEFPAGNYEIRSPHLHIKSPSSAISVPVLRE